jgi:hypothetical protein
VCSAQQDSSFCWAKMFIRDERSSLFKCQMSFAEGSILVGSILAPKSDEEQHSQHLIFFVTYERPHKLDCFITLGWKGLPWTNTLVYWVHL